MKRGQEQKQKRAQQPDHIKHLVPDPANARKHNPRNIGVIVESLHAVGAARSIVIDENNTILAGNGVIEAAGEAGITKMQVVDADGETIVAVRRTGLTPKQKKLLALADNRSNELSDWDDATLNTLLEGLTEEELQKLALTDADLTKLGVEQPESATVDAEPQMDRAAELQKKWKTETGQLWQCGQHRVLCGDSTKREDVERVMVKEKASVMVTDPPYGVDYEGGTVNKTKREKLKGDDSADLFSPALALGSEIMPKGAWYVWHAGRIASPVYAAIESAGFEVRSLIIWNKLKAHYGAPSAHYCQKHEPCLYAVRGNADFTGPSNECTVWDIDQPSKNEHHPTQKPLECMMRPIRNHGAAGSIVFDPFLGSGTTLIACENLGRKCRGIEISPGYVVVILQRFLDATGVQPQLVK